ncbi:MAG: FecR domain-containing protein [Alteromonadaceae bacterium]
MTKKQCPNEIEMQAKYWLWRIEQGLSHQERQSFVAWVNQENDHHLALHKYSPSAKMSKLLADFKGLFPLEKKDTNKYKKLFTPFSLAASVIFFSILTYEAFLNKSLSSFLPKTSTAIVYQQFSTKTGEQFSFNLPDGSLVHLNTNTLLTISFSDNYRQLNLIKGEALFDVAKDKSRPFSVTSGEKSFTALGTIFNVQKSDNDRLELIVTEGRVLIANSNESLPELTKKIANTDKNNKLNSIIVAGEKATIVDKVQLPKSMVSPQTLSQELAWQKGMLIFDGEPLKTALDEISRYTDVIFTIEDQDIAEKKVSGYFKAGDVETLLASISINFELNYTKTNHNNVLITKATKASTLGPTASSML